MVNPLRALWTDRCDIAVQVPERDAVTGRTLFRQETVHQALPCRISFRLSFETVTAVRDTDGEATGLRQSAKLFLAPELQVPPGSSVTVYRGGRVFFLGKSGPPAVYDRHQEIRLELLRRWA